MSTTLDDSEIIAPRNEAEEKLRDYSLEYVPFSADDCFCDYSPAVEEEPCELSSEQGIPPTEQLQSPPQQSYNSYNSNQNNKPNNTASQERIYLNVSYAEKDEAKALGARWDNGCRKWYITAKLNVDQFKKWL